MFVRALSLMPVALNTETWVKQLLLVLDSTKKVCSLRKYNYFLLYFKDFLNSVFFSWLNNFGSKVFLLSSVNYMFVVLSISGDASFSGGHDVIVI